MRPLSNMTLAECRREEDEKQAEFPRLIAERDAAQSRLDAFLLRSKELNDRIIEILESRQMRRKP